MTTYRVPLLDSKLVRLRYAWYYRIKSPSGPSSALAALGTPQPSFGTLNAVEPRLTYPNLYFVGAGWVTGRTVMQRDDRLRNRAELGIRTELCRYVSYVKLTAYAELRSPRACSKSFLGGKD